jgi:sugar/nucleoside kinase (ribokinase family)
VLIHIAVTGSDLTADRDRIVEALRTAGFDASTDGHETGQFIGHYDVLVCLIGQVDAENLLDDGRLSVERPVAMVLDRNMPVLAYQLGGTDLDEPADHRSGYADARLEALRRLLDRAEHFTTVRKRRDLPGVVLDDLSSIGGRLQQAVPDAIRAVHRRIRDHPNPGYDAFSLSMHNVDHRYRVPAVLSNREIAGKYLGAEPGGAGANTIVALRRLGLSTAVAGAVGDDDDGAMLRRALEDDEISTTLVVTVAGVATGHTVMIRALSGYSNVVDAGANQQLEAEINRRGMRRLLDETAAQARVLHFSSFADNAGRRLQESLLNVVPDETVVSYKPGTMDTELGVERLAAIFRRCDALFIADTELSLALEHLPGFSPDMPMSERLDLLFGWRERQGNARPLLVAVMTGMEHVPAAAEPVRLHWGTVRYEGSVGPDQAVSGLALQQVDSVGVRDAVVAGILFGLLRSRPPTDCVNLAYVLALSAFAAYGCRGALLRPTEVRERWRELIGGEPPGWLTPYG